MKTQSSQITSNYNLSTCDSNHAHRFLQLLGFHLSFQTTAHKQPMKSEHPRHRSLLHPLQQHASPKKGRARTMTKGTWGNPGIRHPGRPTLGKKQTYNMLNHGKSMQTQ